MNEHKSVKTGKNNIRRLPILIATGFAFFAFGTIAFAWQPPGVNPPNANVTLGTLLNLSTTSPQTMNGELWGLNNVLTNTGAYLGFNAYYNNGWKYRSTDSAYTIRHDGADLGFYVAPSGTAGSAASLTQVMAIKNTGYVGIGTTSPAAPLAVNGIIYSGSGGFRFPDGTIQTTAGGALASSTLIADWGFKEGPSSWVSAYINNWNIGSGPKISIDCATNAQGCTILSSGTYDVRCVQRQGASNTTSLPFVGIGLNGNRSALENRTDAVWTHDHAANSSNFSESDFLGTLSAGNFITCGAPDSGTSANLMYANNGYAGMLSITRTDPTLLAGTGGGTSQWTTNALGIFYNGGNVGIGTASPSSPLTVGGTIQSSAGGFMFPNGSTMTKAPRVIETTDPRSSGCPPTAAANTDLFVQTFTLNASASVFINAKIISSFNGRADTYLYVDGAWADQALNYTPSQQWVENNVQWAGTLAAGSHTVSMRGNQANTYGCGSSWGKIDTVIFE